MALLDLLRPTSWINLFLAIFLIMLLVGVLFIATMVYTKDADPKDIGEAVYVYLILSFSALLVMTGILPLLVSLFSLYRLPAMAYGAFVMLIIAGGTIIFVISSRMCSQFDRKAVAVPRAIYFCTFYIIGALMCIVGVIYFLITAMSQIGAEQLYEPVRWWGMPLSLLFVGGGTLLAFRFAGEGKFESLCKKFA